MRTVDSPENYPRTALAAFQRDQQGPIWRCQQISAAQGPPALWRPFATSMEWQNSLLAS